jgi:hypothetical protein
MRNPVDARRPLQGYHRIGKCRCRENHRTGGVPDPVRSGGDASIARP